MCNVCFLLRPFRGLGSPQAVADAFGGELASSRTARGDLVAPPASAKPFSAPTQNALLAAIPVRPLIIIAIAAAGGTLATSAPDALAAQNRSAPRRPGRHHRHVGPHR
jgi:hypothetical protein